VNKEKYIDLIVQAWDTTIEGKNLIWYGFIPALFGILFGIFYAIFQYLSLKFQADYNFLNNNKFLSNIIDFVLRDFNTVFIFSIFFIILSLLYIIVPPICQGSLTAVLAKMAKNKKNVRMRDGLSHGLISFLPLIKYHAITGPFSIFLIFSTSMLIYRTFGVNVLKMVIPIYIAFFIFSTVLLFFFTYAEYFIIIRNEKPFSSITKSSKLVLMHWEETFLLLILMFLIATRTIINILLIIGIPSLVFFLGGLLFTSNYTMDIVLFVSLAIGVVIIFIASWINGFLTIFSTAVWTFTFLKIENENMDVV